MDSFCAILYVYRWVQRTQVVCYMCLFIIWFKLYAIAGASTIDQRLVFVGREDGKLLAIRQLIQEGSFLFLGPFNF